MCIVEQRKSILIVGAGPCGLAALKEMREAGLEAVAVDSRNQFGGVFSPDSGVTFEQLYLTTSNMFMAFSDFPPEDKGVKYWSKAEYFSYLEKYVDHFKLSEFIKLGSMVEEANLNDGKWHVTITHEGNKAKRTFDYLIVATGANHTPFTPPIFDGFEGEVIHSSQYHSAEQVKGKKVLVIGAGESATDVAGSASEVAQSVTVWSRRSPHLAPRFLDIITDADYDERRYLPNQNKAGRLPKDFLEIVTTSRVVRNLPLAVWSFALHGLCSDVKAAHGDTSPAGVFHDVCVEGWKTDYFSSDTSNVPTKAASMCTSGSRREMDFVVAPSMQCKGNTVTFNETSYYGIEFTPDKDAVDVDVDIIVACTGYQLSFDHWLSTPTPVKPNPRMWYKHCFPPELGEYMAFIGYARPHQGGIPQCGEILARYIAQLQLGNLTLPKDYPSMAITESNCEKECFHLTPDYNVLVDYSAFMFSVARLIGCEPKTPLLSPSEMVKYWTFPLWPCFFRSQGVGAKPYDCDAVLDKFDAFDALAPMPLLAIQVIFTFLMPFISFVSYCLNPIFNIGSTTTLPRGYQFRMSKLNFMHGYWLCPSDFLKMASQVGAGCTIVLSGILSLLADVEKKMSKKWKTM